MQSRIFLQSKEKYVVSCVDFGKSGSLFGEAISFSLCSDFTLLGVYIGAEIK